jgi:predicted NUDIX family NTP pyrophosphohydrolase
MKVAAGIVVYRRGAEGLEILLVHPSGNYNRHAPWSIPKGEPNPGESLEDAARRETLEEIGIAVGDLRSLGSITYRKSRKQVHAFAVECGTASPCCSSWEVDRAEFLTLDTARQLLHPDQRPLLDRLIDSLGS